MKKTAFLFLVLAFVGTLSAFGQQVQQPVKQAIINAYGPPVWTVDGWAANEAARILEPNKSLIYKWKTWTSKTGDELVAQFVSLNELTDEMFLRDARMHRFMIPFHALSEDDRMFVIRHWYATRQARFTQAQYKLAFGASGEAAPVVARKAAPDRRRPTPPTPPTPPGQRQPDEEEEQHYYGGGMSATERARLHELEWKQERMEWNQRFEEFNP